MNGTGRAPYGKYGWANAYILTGYIENYQGFYGSVVPWDLAGGRTRPAGRLRPRLDGLFRLRPRLRFQGQLVGYPGDMPDSTMWRASCDVDPNLVDQTNMDYECDTWPGSSGSAVYDYNPGTNQRWINGVNLASSPSVNTGLRLTGYFAWVKQHAGN